MSMKYRTEKAVLSQQTILDYLLLRLKELEKEIKMYRRVVTGGGLTRAAVIAAVEGEATLDLTGDLGLQDDKYLYFDTAKTKYIRYSTDHADMVTSGTWAAIADLDFYADSGVDGSGSWEPQLALSHMGSVIVTNTTQGDAVDRMFRIRMTEGLELRTAGSAYAKVKADNIATTNKTFQFPNASGTLIGTGNLTDVTQVGTQTANVNLDTGNSLVFGDIMIKRLNVNSLKIRNSADTLYKNLYLNSIVLASDFSMPDAKSMKTASGGAYNFYLKGWDVGASTWNTVATVQGHATDPYIELNVAGNITMLDQKMMTLGTYTDAQRPAAGTAGRVIFNTDDGMLNYDDGVNWRDVNGNIT